MKRTVLLGAIATVFLAGTAVQADPTIHRQAMMKNTGAATGLGAKMMKGEMDFDLIHAQNVIRVMNQTALGMGYLFPEGSEQGNETEAAAAIWSDSDGFNAAVAKFITDTSVPVTDEASFKAAFAGATQNCGSCHEGYRVKNQ